MYCSEDFAIRQLTAAAEEPLSLDEAKAHLHLEPEVTDFDDLIASYLLAARDYLENTYNVRLLKQTVEYTVSQFPREDRIKLRVWPVQSVDYVRLTDTAGNVSTVTVGTAAAGAVLRARLNAKPCELVLGWEKIWPTTILDTADGIAIGLTVGFRKDDSPESLPLPEQVKHAMRFLIEFMFRNTSAITQGPDGLTDVVKIGVDNFMANVRLY